MGVERDVTGKANFVMWHARACGKLMVSALSKARAHILGFDPVYEEGNTYTNNYHEVVFKSKPSSFP